MYVRVTVEVWQAGKEPASHRATMVLQDVYINAISEGIYARIGKRVYSKVVTIGHGEDLNTGLVMAFASVITAAYRRYVKANS